MLPNDSDTTTLPQQFGSGGGSFNNTQGGGRIAIIGLSLVLLGQINANGYPTTENLDSKISYCK